MLCHILRIFVEVFITTSSLCQPDIIANIDNFQVCWDASLAACSQAICSPVWSPAREVKELIRKCNLSLHYYLKQYNCYILFEFKHVCYFQGFNVTCLRLNTMSVFMIHFVKFLQQGHFGLRDSSGSSTATQPTEASLLSLPVVPAAVWSGCSLPQAVWLPAR